MSWDVFVSLKISAKNKNQADKLIRRDQIKLNFYNINPTDVCFSPVRTNEITAPKRLRG